MSDERPTHRPRRPPAGRTRILAVVGVALVAVLFVCVWYVFAPPRGVEAYRTRSAQTAESLRSSAATAQLWARLEGRGDATGNAATVGIEDAERAASRAASAHAAWDPPPGLDGLADSLGSEADALATVLADMRVAAHRDDWQEVATLADRLPRLARRLDALEQEARG